MVVIIMTNAHMGVSCFDRNGFYASSYCWKPISSCGFSSSRSFTYGVALNTMNVKKMRVFALSKGETDNLLHGGGIIEKEFEFKPTFDEYLKALESLKTGREKKQTHTSNRHKVKDDSRGKDMLRTQSLEKDEENAKLREFGGFPDEKRMPKVFERQLYENGEGVATRGGMRGHFDCEDRGIGESKDNLDGEGTGRDKRVQRKMGGQIMNVKYSQDSNWNKSRKAQKAQENFVVSDNANSKRSTIDIKRELGHNKNSSDMLKRKEKTSKGEESAVTLARKYIQSERVTDVGTVFKSGNLTRSSKVFRAKNYVSNLNVESAAFKNFEASNDIVDKPRVSRMEMEERTQKLAKWLNGSDIDMPEWMFSKMMRSAKIRFSDHSILRVIQLLGKLGNWRRVLQVIEWLQMRERFKSHRTRYIYTTALDVLGKSKRPVEALNVFHAMQQQMSSYPDLVAYHSIAVTLGQAGHIKELFGVIDSMRSPPKKKFKTGPLGKWDPRMEPDIVVYNAVLNACVYRKQWEGAFWVLQQLKEHGQRRSATTYGLVMEVMFACGKYNLVHEFFRKLQNSSIPNALAYRVLVNTLWKEGKTDEAVSLVREMERRGIVGSAALYYDLARCLCSAGRCQEALMLMEKICKVATQPLVVTYTGLIQACLDSGNIQNGAYIFNQMKDFCSPNLVTCNIMLKAYVENGLFEEAKELFQKMSEDGYPISSRSEYKVRVLPDTYTFNTMLDACVAEERWDDFDYVYRRMLHHGYHFNAKRHLRMILDACRAGKEELLETTWEHLGRADRVPPPALIKERFCMKLEKGDHSSALYSINNIPVSELHAFSKSAWLNLLKENARRFRKDTFIRLIEDVSILIARSESRSLVLQNLLTSSKDFFRIYEGWKSIL